MGNTMAETVPRSRFGVWSLIFAAVAFAIAITSLLVLLKVPETASDFAGNLFFYGFLIAAPLLHLTGLGFAIVAVMRRGDRKSLGVLGIIINWAAVALGLGLVWLMLHAGAAFT
jgi:hypothetical protein